MEHPGDLRRFTSVMKLLLFTTAMVAVLVLTACGNGGSEPLSSGIRGRALAGPQCPVVQAGSPCPDKPIEVSVDVLNESGDRVTTFRTDSDGRFEVDLPPGEYTLDPLPPNPDSPFPSGVQQMVIVESGRFTDVTIQYDTGIR